jgi:hypothetical protein
MNQIRLISAFFLIFPQLSFAFDLKDYAENYLSFEENNYQFLKTAPQFEEKRNQLASSSKNASDGQYIPDQIFHKLDQDLAKTRKIVTDTANYRAGDLRGNILLSRLFEFRYQQTSTFYLDYVSKIQNGLKQNTWQETFWGTEDLSGLAAQNTVEAQWNFAIGSSSVDRYHWVSKLIKQLLVEMRFKSISLSEANRFWIRCSTQLHPYLRGESELPGYPEHAAGCNLPNIKERPSHSELDLCKYYSVKSIRIQTPLLTLGARNAHISVLFTPYEITQMSDLPMNFRKKHLPSPELPQFEFSQVLLPQTEIEEFTPALESNGISESEDLDLALGLSLALEEELQSSPHKDESTSPLLAPDLEQSTLSSEHISKKAGLQTTYPEASQLESEPFVIETVIKPKKLNPSEISKKSKKTKKSPTEFPIQMPSGIRKFHPKQHQNINNNNNTIPETLSSLNKSQQDWLIQLFSHEKSEFNYRIFEKIWKKLNGPNSIVKENGTSHQKLLNSNRETVGSIFSHGKSQKYFGSYLNYLRAPFIAIGINQNVLNQL